MKTAQYSSVTVGLLLLLSCSSQGSRQASREGHSGRTEKANYLNSGAIPATARAEPTAAGIASETSDPVQPRPSPFAEPHAVQPQPALDRPPLPPAVGRRAATTHQKPFVVPPLPGESQKLAVLKTESLPPAPILEQPAAGKEFALPSTPRCCVATAVYEPVKEPRLQRMIQKVPGLRRLGKSPAAGEDLSPPHPVREITFSLPDTTSSVAAGPRHVALKADIDEAGGVTRVELLAPRDEHLLSRAADAANDWKFVPGRLNGQAVPSQIIIHFWFDR